MHKGLLVSRWLVLAVVFAGLLLPQKGQAQYDSVCGVFMQNPSSNYLDFGIMNERVVFTTIRPGNYQEMLGVPFAENNYVVLSGIQWSGSDAIIGFSSAQLVQNCYEQVPLAATPLPAPVLNFYPDTFTLLAGQCTQINWVANEAFTYAELSLDGQPAAAVPLQGSTVVCPTADALYRLSALQGDQFIHSELIITVLAPTAPPPTVPPPPPATNLPVPATEPPAAQAAPPSAANPQDVVLNVTPINQRIANNPIYLAGPGGTQITDNGEYDCLVASVAMALGFFKDQGLLQAADAPTYRDLVPIMRGSRDARTGLDTNTLMITDPILPKVTNGHVSAQYVTVAPANVLAFIAAEAQAGRPVLGVALEMEALAQGAQGDGHAILIIGTNQGNIRYIDPYGGGIWELPIETFTAPNAVVGYFVFTVTQ